MTTLLEGDEEISDAIVLPSNIPFPFGGSLQTKVFVSFCIFLHGLKLSTAWLYIGWNKWPDLIGRWIQ